MRNGKTRNPPLSSFHITRYALRTTESLEQFGEGAADGGDVIQPLGSVALAQRELNRLAEPVDGGHVRVAFLHHVPEEALVFRPPTCLPRR